MSTTFVTRELPFSSGFGITVVIVCLLLFGAPFWASDSLDHTATPTQVMTTPDGALAVVLGHELLLGRDRVDTLIDLEELGLYSSPPGMTFLPDGDLLVRPGTGSIARCDLTSRVCRPVAGNLPLTTDPCWIDRDSDGTLYLSSPDAERILAVDLSGQYRRLTDQSPFVPRQFLLKEWGLLDPASGDWTALPPYLSTGAFALQPLPSDGGSRPLWVLQTLKVDGGWWVLFKGRDKLGGTILRFDEDWSRPKAIILSAPVAMTLFGGRVVVADIGRRQVLQFLPNGHPLPDLAWPELQVRQAAADDQSESLHKLISVLPFGVIGIVITLLFIALASPELPKGLFDSPPSRWALEEQRNRDDSQLFVIGVVALIFFPLMLFLLTRFVVVPPPIALALVALPILVGMGVLLYRYKHAQNPATPNPEPNMAQVYTQIQGFYYSAFGTGLLLVLAGAAWWAQVWQAMAWLGAGAALLLVPTVALRLRLGTIAADLPPVAVEPEEPTDPRLADPSIVWIELPRWEREIRQASNGLYFVYFFLVYLIAKHAFGFRWGDIPGIEWILFFVLIPAALLIGSLIGARHDHRIGVRGRTVLLHQNGTITEAPIEQVFSSGRAILVGDLRTPLDLYPPAQIERHLLPLLARAAPIAHRELQKRWFNEQWSIWLLIGFCWLVGIVMFWLDGGIQ